MTHLPSSFEFKTPKIDMQITLPGEIPKSFVCGGVYVFYGDWDTCLYVGQSRDLRGRLMTHLTSSPFSRKIVRADIYSICDPYEREIFETAFIHHLKPEHNRAKVFVVNSEEVDETLLEIAELEYERELLSEELSDILSDVSFEDRDGTYADFTDSDERLSHMLGANLRAATEIPELESQIKRISDEIGRLKRQIR